MFDFFIDTANIAYIRENIMPLVEDCKNYVLGITTNPNAMAKIKHHTLAQWEDVLPKLCALVTEIRGDSLGEVYVQIPNSKMNMDEVADFAEHINKFSDGKTRLGLKIPPNIDLLTNVHWLKEIMPINVTGLADCCTALSCTTYGVDYASIIPGRMNEVGINASAHLSFLRKRRGTTEIIAGSMRSLEGLINAIAYNTTPTIGERVWEDIIDNDVDITKLQISDDTTEPSLFAPHIDGRNIQLSVDFFTQMDKLGEQVYKDLKSR